ncbi:hypothetical protein R3W88_024685 [Solanum pinnatisectum]|uniref:DUF4283 domain-containing protein n=1 Tax=Solanum pinnatisectum TaxID=50273 RepID=A0AAV9M4T7_9SOLN|nr:hypothetical protein R3W88_024685 [Solanum pinnatisectum]
MARGRKKKEVPKQVVTPTRMESANLGYPQGMEPEVNLGSRNQVGTSKIQPTEIQRSVLRDDTQRKLELNDGPNKKWANFFNSNRMSAKGICLNFVNPIMQNGEWVIELKKEEIEKATEEWKQALILIYLDDRNEVLYSDPYMLNNKPIIVKVLPLCCWSQDSLSRISSGLGFPLYADEFTAKVDRISFDIVLMEMDVSGELPKKLKVEDPNGRVFEQVIQYEWIPEYCTKCMQVGRQCNRNKGTKPKKKNINAEIGGSKSTTETNEIVTEINERGKEQESEDAGT